MDRYTKMCDHPLIQDGWVPKVGDWVSLYPASFQVYFLVELYYTDNYIILFDLDRASRRSVDRKNLIWLPSIEQLMGMLKDYSYEFRCRPGGEFYKHTYWSPNCNPINGNNKYEVLIQGVFHELHGMKWDEKGERWVKS